MWEFPGGKREKEESFEQCLRRELREELGIEVCVRELLETVTHSYPEKTVRLNFYRCDLLEGEPQPLGCADLKWVAVRELPLFKFPPADERLLALLQQNIGLWG